ncbi:MAG: DNA polymerase I [Thiobacillaceae bacterium]|nr:DNA polymerase I [Thiobacillaceae bacterium]
MTKTLLLVDGSSYLYRAFHALPDLRNRDGEPTGALYGVINMLRRLRREVPADYVACVFDAKGKTFRDALYPEYKAHRPPMPADLATQIEPLHAAIRALGWPLLVVEGVEADDVIGTLARQAEAEGLRSVISSGDKDLSQLVSERVTVIDTLANRTYDPAGVREKFGVPPERVLDWLTLVGDAVDNVPGVDKVGPKTASKWLAEYGSLDNLIAHAGEIKGVAGENLRRALDWLPLARALLTVKTDVALPVTPAGLHWQPEDRDRLTELFTRYNFRSWLAELHPSAASVTGAGGVGEAPPSGQAAPPPPWAGEGKLARRYATVLDAAGLERWLERIEQAELTCVDTETTSLDPMRARLVGLSLSVEPGEAAYLPLAHRYAGAPDQLPLDQVLARLKPWLENPGRAKVGQNLKYDWHVLMNHGIALQGIAHDTLLESYVLEAHERHDMDSLAERHLDETTIRYEEVCGKGAGQIGFDQVDIERATEYAAEDADITLRLHAALHPRLKAESGLDYVYGRVEMPLMPVLARMERTGVLLDCDLLRRHSDFLAREMLEIEAKAHAAAGQPFNLNSPKQLAEIFFGQLGLPVLKKTPKGAPSTDEEVLERLALDFPLPRLVLDYRGLAKLKSTYTDKLPQMVDPATGRVHTTYSQAVAVTGRLSSVDPNLQNIPVRSPEGRKIREAFIAAPGCVIVSADYSQIELRIMAHLSGDAGLLKAFREDADIHRATAAEVQGLDPEQVSVEQRRMAKAVNFGLIYGMSAFGLAAQLNIERAAAQNYIDRYFARYPGVARYMADTREKAKQDGYVETLFGRRLYLPEIRGGNPGRRQGAERAAINAPMQGTAADLIKLAMLAVQGWLDAEKLKSRLIMQVHDELVLEVAKDELERVRARLPGLMCGVAELRVPLKVEAGEGANWEAAH